MADDVTSPEESGDTATAVAEAPAKLAQQVEITDAGPCKKHVKVTVDRAAIDGRFDEKFSELVLGSQAPIAGFRPGKAPRKIIEKRFYREVAGEVRQEVLMASLEQLAEEQSLSPLAPPDLNPAAVVIPESGPLVYEFDIEVRPEFDLPSYKGLKIRRPTHTFTDADVAKESKRVLEPFGQIVPKEGDNAAVALDDVITADVVITRDGNAINTIKEVRVRVEKRLALSDGVAEGFAAKMGGAKVGETRTVDIQLAQGVAPEGLQAGTVQAAFTINEIKVVRQPELNDELLNRFGVRTTEAFNELIRARLERFLEYSQRQEARQQVLQQLAGEQKWDLPRDLLARQSRKTLQRKVLEMRNAGMTDAQILGRQRILEQDAVRSTAEALKEHFVLQKIAETEKLEIEEADIDAEVERIADQTGESPRKVRARMEKEDLIETLATELLERKALDMVLETAEYEDYEQNPVEHDDAEAVSTVEAQAVPEGEKPAEAAPAANG